MRKLAPVLLLLGCAQVQKDSPDSIDLAFDLPADILPQDDAGSGLSDLSGPPVDLTSGARGDLRGPSLDMAGPPPDLASTDLSVPSYSYPRVNEVATAVGGVELDEYIELVGGDTDTTLFGWSLWYQPPGGGFGEQLLSFPVLSVLPAHRYLLITASGSSFVTSADQVYTSPATGKLLTAGGAVGLFQGLTRMDSMGWGTATGNYVEDRAAPSPGDKGCSRLPDGVDTDHNQVDFKVAPTTPRSVNHP